MSPRRKIADEGGFDFFLPIARWAGFGGETKAREWSFETFTWAAGLAALTKRIAIFATVHVPLVHPIYAAKALATVDHISNGRAGLNIVCGWNPKEFAMFGTTPDERAYERAAEWISIVERAYASDEPFDFDGAYYKLKGVVSKPASLQKPRPVTMNAAFGGPGRDFAARHCDFLFSTFTDIEDGRKHLADIRARAAAAKRDVGAYTVCHVVCRATQAEAEDAYDRYALARGRSRRGRQPHGRQEAVLAVARRARLPRLPAALRRRRGDLSAGRHAGTDRGDDRGDRRGRMVRARPCRS